MGWKIYCIPANANQVLKLNISTGKVSLFGDKTLLAGKMKWYGGNLGDDGFVYGTPNCAKTIIRIIPGEDRVETFGMLSNVNWKWHGAANGSDGCFYAFPSHANTVLRIDPKNNAAQEIGNICIDEVMPESRRNEGKYKYGGGNFHPGIQL